MKEIPDQSDLVSVLLNLLLSIKHINYLQTLVYISKYYKLNVNI